MSNCSPDGQPGRPTSPEPPSRTGTPSAGAPSDEQPLGTRALDRRIASLALPALGALVAEPLFVLVDSAVVGRLGVAELGGLALASTVLTTVIGLCVFLAYATTAGVARRLGAGDRAGAARLGVDGLWLALGLGGLLAVALWVAAPVAVEGLGAPARVVPHAVAYLRWSAPGLPAMLLVLAAVGVLRGTLDTRTPLWTAAGGAVLNAVLSVVLVHGAGMGVAGSGLGTTVAQLAMAGVLGSVVVRTARRDGTSLRPHARGMLTGLRVGGPLLARTATLRVAILLAAWVAAGQGPVSLAGHQVVMAVWGLTAFALDAVAIAAQALIGRALGAGDVPLARAVMRRCLRWGTATAAALGLALAATGWWLGPLFTADDDVRRAITLSLVVVGVTLPVAGWVFVLDGVLIGAGDGRYLAAAGVVSLAAYVPAALAARAWADAGPSGLAWSWVAFAGAFMAARAVTTGARARGTAWTTTGV